MEVAVGGETARKSWGLPCRLRFESSSLQEYRILYLTLCFSTRSSSVLTDGRRKYLPCPGAPVPLKSYTVVNIMSEWSTPITIEAESKIVTRQTYEDVRGREGEESDQEYAR